jgi:hypothetical protein
MGVNIKKCCCAHPCSACVGGTTGTWAVSFVDVDTAMPCTNCAAAGVGFVQGRGSFSGTYTLVQRAPPNFCEWRVDVSAPTLDTDGTDCSNMITSGSGPTRIDILATSSTTFELRAYPPAGGNIYYFRETITTTDCCSAHTFTNARVAYFCDPSVVVAGINGHAVATPNC